MFNMSRCIFFLLSIHFCLICGCGSGTTTITNTTKFPVLVFSDVHFNPFYDKSLFPALFSADAGGWESIFKNSGITAPSERGSDTNYPLLKLALSSIKQNRGASPLIIYTGDILGHNFTKTFYELYGVKGVPSDADVAAMKAFTDKTVAFFMDQVRSSVGNIPVMFAVGNSDSYSFIDDGPDSSFLSNTAELYYTKFLNGAVDHQAFLTTFTSGGYYSAEPPGTKLMVISLNTVKFSPDYPSSGSAVAAELAWLDSRLASARAAGKKVWLLMHIPPGAVMGPTAQSVDAEGHITSATMMWDQNYQALFLQILSHYPGLITLTLAAHTHMDEFRIMSSSDVLEITPGITPYFGNNPAYKVFTLSRDTLKPTDYSSLNYDLATMPGQFNSYYTFSTAYAMHGPLNASLAQLYPELVTNKVKQALYRGHYYSGYNSVIPVTYPDGNSYSPITDLNWPVYWSGIGNMEQQEFIDSVNAY